MPAIATAELPSTFHEIETWVLRTLDDLAWLRGSLRQVLTGAATPDETRAEIPERICLVASELTADTMRHHHTPTAVRLLSDGRQFIVDVASTSLGERSGRWPDDHDEGLTLARKVADGVNWYQAWNATHVWARFDVPSWTTVPAA